MNPMEIALDCLPKGTVVQISHLVAQGSFGSSDAMVTQRLKELGFLPGMTLHVLGFGFFGRDPIAVSINGTKFALRRNEASKVITIPITTEAV